MELLTLRTNWLHIGIQTCAQINIVAYYFLKYKKKTKLKTVTSWTSSFFFAKKVFKVEIYNDAHIITKSYNFHIFQMEEIMTTLFTPIRLMNPAS